MEFPEEIITLIRDYSKPLKRRTISDFWLWENIVNFDDMVSYVYNHVIKYFPGPVKLQAFNTHYVIQSNLNLFRISFTKKELMCWSGEYEYKNQWILEQDVYYKQLLNEKKVVFSKSYFHGKLVHSENACKCHMYYYGTCNECHCLYCGQTYYQCDC